MTNSEPVPTLGAMRSDSGTTTGRNIRIPDDLWEKAKAKAAADETSTSEVIRDLLADYVADKKPGYTVGVRDGRREILDRLK